MAVRPGFLLLFGFYVLFCIGVFRQAFLQKGRVLSCLAVLPARNSVFQANLCELVTARKAVNRPLAAYAAF